MGVSPVPPRAYASLSRRVEPVSSGHRGMPSKSPEKEKLARSPRRHGGFLAINQSLEPGFQLCRTKINNVTEA